MNQRADEPKVDDKKKLAHIPRFLRRLNSTLFAKATAEQLFLVNLDIEKKKHEKFRNKPKQHSLRTLSDRCIQIPPIDRASNKNSILGGKSFGLRPMNGFQTQQPSVIEGGDKREKDGKTDNRIINHKSKKPSTLPVEEFIERSAYSE